LALHWDKVSNGGRGFNFDTFCNAIAALPNGSIWRHNQAGDLPHVNGNIDHLKLIQLSHSNMDKKGFTYTHHKPNKHNSKWIKFANNAGFTINLSAENLSEADSYSDLNIGPVVTIIDTGLPVKMKTPKGRDVITCPATYKDNVSCFNCQLCQKQSRAIIAFPVHGTSKAKARKVFLMQSV
tara:strand:- start:134 stop:676 length:543 start_codon:yes stop_codon:yes gene_type:complete